MNLRRLTFLSLVLGLLATHFAPALASDAPRVRFTTTLGNFTVELAPGKAPKTVANFLQYVADKHYDGTTFHRVIPGFMAQGGGFTPTLEQKPTRAPIRNEANNGLKNQLGTIAMARTPDPHSASAQFFINVADNDFLNFRDESTQGWGYAVFGRVVDGMDVVSKMVNVPRGQANGMGDVPRTPIVIQSAVLLDAAKK